jgi:hypothetical protein
MVDRGGGGGGGRGVKAGLFIAYSPNNYLETLIGIQNG